MAKRGRETKYDDDRAKIILDGVGEGLTRDCVAELAGITPRTLYSWIRLGASGIEPFVSFSSAIKKAERQAEAHHIGIVKKAAEKSWFASAWWLERKFPESWGKDTETMREMVAEYRKRKKARAGKKQPPPA